MGKYLRMSWTMCRECGRPQRPILITPTPRRASVVHLKQHSIPVSEKVGKEKEGDERPSELSVEEAPQSRQLRLADLEDKAPATRTCSHHIRPVDIGPGASSVRFLEFQ